MLLGQRLAHRAPKRRRGIRYLGECLAGGGDVLPNMKAGSIRAPAFEGDGRPVLEWPA